jgi:hypothetical protein
VREIDDADIPEVVNLITRGYGTVRFSREFREYVFLCLRHRSVPAGFPRYGYVLESDGKLVGTIILIFSTIWENGEAKIRCNGSSLYVDPAFRIYAPLLISRLLNYENVTVLNITAAPHTYGMVQAQKFIKYSNGILVAIPVLSQPPKGSRPRIIDAHDRPDVPFDSHERDLLLEHADYGCVSVWCIAHERAYPFVFRPRTVKFLPCAQLVYCQNIDSFVQFARPIGLYLARRLRLLVLLDANGPVRGLVGKYFLGKTPRYFFGPDQPRLGDLAYTETSMFGI